MTIQIWYVPFSVSNYIHGDKKNIDVKSHLQGIKTFHEIGNVDVTMGTLKRYNRTRTMLQPWLPFDVPLSNKFYATYNFKDLIKCWIFHDIMGNIETANHYFNKSIEMSCVF